jgi:hypothetical protein
VNMDDSSRKTFQRRRLWGGTGKGGRWLLITSEAGFDKGVPPKNYAEESGEKNDVEDVFGAANKAVSMENGDIEDIVPV